MSRRMKRIEKGKKEKVYMHTRYCHVSSPDCTGPYVRITLGWTRESMGTVVRRFLTNTKSGNRCRESLALVPVREVCGNVHTCSLYSIKISTSGLCKRGHSRMARDSWRLRKLTVWDGENLTAYLIVLKIIFKIDTINSIINSKLVYTVYDILMSRALLT